MDRRKAVALAAMLDKQFLATDYSPSMIVIARAIDTIAYHVFESAFFQKHEDYYLVFPEHHEPQVFHEEEYWVVQHQQIYEK